jgi:hypothetical protein
MTLIDVFYQGEDLDEVQHLEADPTTTVATLKPLLHAKHGCDENSFLFLEDEDEPLDDTVAIASLVCSGGLKLHFHRQRHVDVTVVFNGEEVSKRFSPAATVARVKRWAAKRRFEMSKEEAGEHVLQISGTHERPNPGTHIGALRLKGCHTLGFDLVPDQRVNGHVSVQL